MRTETEAIKNRLTAQI